MKKRTEILAITLVLTGSAIAAALTSDIGINQAHAEETAMLPADTAAPAATTDTSTPERELTPVVYDMDIPADVMSDYEASSPQTDDPLPAEDAVATDHSNEEVTPSA